VLLEFLQTITGVFVVVYDGQHALRFTLGRAKRVVGPGVHWKWPIIQSFRVKDTRHTTLDLEPQVIQLADDLIYEVDAKVLYQITNLHKALIEIDDLEEGLKNRVVLAIQRVLSRATRESVKDTVSLQRQILEELGPVEEQWGVRILHLGFSGISPSPATLEITQLDLLARERLALYHELEQAGLTSESATALVTGAVVTAHPLAAETGWAAERREMIFDERAEERRQDAEDDADDDEDELDGDELDDDVDLSAPGDGEVR
jgi:regulator of protease activity HflC (stomatin/prohibitin superfamily)